MSVTPSHYLVLAAAIFCVGAFGFLVRRNLLLQLMCIELMLNAANLVLVAANRWHVDDLAGQRFAMLVMALAAAEAGVGLAIVINVFRRFGSVRSDRLSTLRG